MLPSKNTLIRECLKKRILILDGATGTMLQRFHLEENDFRGSLFPDHPTPLKGDNDVLNLTCPDKTRTVHRLYLEAGADIITTNTFNSTRLSQAAYGMEAHCYDMAFAAVKNARAEAAIFTGRTPEKPRFVAGDLGPLGKTLSMSADVNDPGSRAVTFEEVAAAYSEQINAMLDADVDILLFETIFDTLNTKAGLYAASKIFEERGFTVPVMISGTLSDASGRLLSGQNAEAFLYSISHAPDLLSVGFNCALGPEEMRPHIAELAQKAPFFVSTHPNAGLPDELGRYPQTPETMSGLIRGFAQDGLVNIVGGCCGTTPEHIAAIAAAVDGLAPRKVPQSVPALRLSGLDPLVSVPEVPFLNVGERTNVAGSRKFLKLIQANDYAEGLRIARKQIEDGARIIDVNMDDALLDSAECMRKFLLNLASEPEIARVPVMIDSSKWDVIRAGLQCLQGKCVVNSISLKEGESLFLEKALEVRRFGAAVLCMAFDEQGQADSVDRRVQVCSRMYDILTKKAGFAPSDIIFDVNVFAVATGMEEHDRCAADFIDAVRILKKKYPDCHFSGGISNVSFAFRGNDTVRGALHCVFLYHAIRAGLDMGIVNPAQLSMYEDLEPQLRNAAEDVILARDPAAAERLLTLAAGIAGAKEDGGKDEVPAWRREPLEARIIHDLICGDDTWLKEDMAEAQTSYPSPVSIIEGPLMNGMKEAGNRFASGKMFLPQIVKTARVMKSAVECLLPALEAAKTEKGTSAGTVILATVKGDVHDIGKNIVGVVLRCNNYNVIDLGVMTPPAKILDAAKSEHADAILLSGLITPSLAEMAFVASEMERLHFTIPLLIGGATTSKIHTALKLQPLYSGPVVHAADASRDVPILAELLDPARRDAFVKQLNQEYAEIRAQSEAKTSETEFVTPEEARKNRATLNYDAVPVIREEAGLYSPAFSDLTARFDWKFFYQIWKVSGRSAGRETAQDQLRRDAEKLMAELMKLPDWRPAAVFRFFPADSLEDDIRIYADETRSVLLAQLPMMRMQTRQSAGPNASLTDYLAPDGAASPDRLGTFVLTTGIPSLRAGLDEYGKLLCDTICDVLAEALCGMLHDHVCDGHGIRPVPGYPVMPDHTLKRDVFRLLEPERSLPVKLLESCMIDPGPSIAGFIFPRSDAAYFAIGSLPEDYRRAYGKRRGLTEQELNRFVQ